MFCKFPVVFTFASKVAKKVAAKPKVAKKAAPAKAKVAKKPKTKSPKKVCHVHPVVKYP